jgi:hypothetical protein
MEHDTCIKCDGELIVKKILDEEKGMIYAHYCENCQQEYIFMDYDYSIHRIQELKTINTALNTEIEKNKLDITEIEDLKKRLTTIEKHVGL